MPARVLVGLSREDLAERAGPCCHSIRKWEISSNAIPGAMYSHLIRVVDVLEVEGARFSGDGVSALSGESSDPLCSKISDRQRQVDLIKRLVARHRTLGRSVQGLISVRLACRTRFASLNTIRLG
jgi:hypothetical protein